MVWEAALIRAIIFFFPPWSTTGRFISSVAGWEKMYKFRSDLGSQSYPKPSSLGRHVYGCLIPLGLLPEEGDHVPG